MRLKIFNAIMSLITIVMLLVHIGYNVYAYLTFSYNPVLTETLSYCLLTAMCLHAVLGMCSVFLLGDGTRLSLYPGQNLRTVIQRVTAAFIFPLLLLHINSYSLLVISAEGGRWIVFGLLVMSEICFYGIIIMHAAVSLTRAFITLGWIVSRKMQKTLDRMIYIVSAALFLLASVSVIRTQIIMFAL